MEKARVHIDFHVELDGHVYSVPHRLVKEQLELLYTEMIAEGFYKGNRVHLPEALYNPTKA